MGKIVGGEIHVWREMCCEPDWNGERFVHSEGCTRLESNYKKEEGE